MLSHYLPIYKHVIVASVIINIIGVAGSLFTMNVYDRVVPNNATATLWVLTSGILLAYFCDFLLRNLRGYFVDVAGRNADVVISSKLVDKVLSMRFDKKPESTGALVNNLREFEALRDFSVRVRCSPLWICPSLFSFWRSRPSSEGRWSSCRCPPCP